MKKLLIPLLIIGALFLFGRSSSAAPLPPASDPSRRRTGGGSGSGSGSGSGPVPSYGQVNPMDRAEVEAGWADARRQIDEDFRVGQSIYASNREAFDAYPAPIPPPLVAVVMARESGGRDINSRIGEQGYLQLTPAEVAFVGGGNPHDMKDSIRMCQKLYQSAINKHPQENAEDESFIALLSRSIGPGALRWVLSRIPAGEGRLTDRVERWLTETPERPVGIRQSDRKFTLRIARALMRADRAEREAMLPANNLPRFA